MHARTHPDGEATAWQRAPLNGHSDTSTVSAPSPAARPLHAFICPFAHHSSILPWRAAGATMHFIPEDCEHDTGIDLIALASSLAAVRAADAGADMIVVATAASNISGVICAMPPVNAIAHAHGALAVWDCAAAAPHMSIDMNPKHSLSLASISAEVAAASPSIPSHAPWPVHADAVYFSCHKLLGGPGAPGVLVLKRSLMRSTTPVIPGGGTVFFVHSDGTPRYLANDAEREEGGSPDLIACVRAGLAIHVARSVGATSIIAREAAMAHVARSRWGLHPNICLINSASGRAPAVPILALVITVPGCAPSSTAPLRVRGTPEAQMQLHWGFVTAVLNDVFGIQCRGGCLCAGPYAMQLLGIDDAREVALERALLSKHELLRPGVVRLSFPYYMSHATFRYTLAAVEWVASHAAALLHLYTPVHDTGEWKINRSAAQAALGDGYRYLASAGASKGVFEARLPVDTVVTSVGTWSKSYRSASDIIAARLVSDPAGHAADAMRGGTRAHPRRWLQDLRFQADGSVDMPSYRIGLTPAVDDADDAQLLWAYLVEAAVLLTGVRSLARASTAVATHHDPRAVLPSSEFMSMRWFVLAGDVAGVVAAADDAVRAVVEVPSLAAGVDEAVVSWTQPPASLVHVLSTPNPTAEQLALWNGSQRGPSVAAPAAAAAASALPVSSQAKSGGSASVPRKRVHAAMSQAADAASVADAVAPSAPDVVAPPSSAKRPRAPKPSDEVIAARRARAAAVKQALTGIMSAVPAGTPDVLAPMLARVRRAIGDFNMIRDGDRVMLGLSGGKDSLTLLALLLHLQAHAPISFDVAACTVDPQYPGFDPSPLKAFMARLGVPYFYASEPIVDLAARHMQRDSICSFCSRMKRGILYTTARVNGYNVLALGQHADDFAESFVMSAFRNGLLRTMKACYENDAGDVRIIRPLVYSRERDTRAVATTLQLPVISENCPACFSGPTQRYHVKKILATEESTNTNLMSSLLRTMRVLMTSDGEAFVKTQLARMEGGTVAALRDACATDADCCDDDEDDVVGAAADSSTAAGFSFVAKRVILPVANEGAAAAVPAADRFVLQRPAASSAMDVDMHPSS